MYEIQLDFKHYIIKNFITLMLKIQEVAADSKTALKYTCSLSCPVFISCFLLLKISTTISGSLGQFGGRPTSLYKLKTRGSTPSMYINRPTSMVNSKWQEDIETNLKWAICYMRPPSIE